ncbi:MAG: hypothetical protein P8Y58_16825 [Novosphingobium sp.]
MIYNIEKYNFNITATELGFDDRDRTGTARTGSHPQKACLAATPSAGCVSRLSAILAVRNLSDTSGDHARNATGADMTPSPAKTGDESLYV